MDRIRNAVTRARQTRDSNRADAPAETAPTQPATVTAAAQQAQAAIKPMRALGETSGATDSLGLPRVDCDFAQFARNRIIANEQCTCPRVAWERLPECCRINFYERMDEWAIGKRQTGL